MFHIAICDDEVNTCSEIKAFVKRFCTQNNAAADIESFCTGESFTERLKEVTFDLTFLDIELPDTDGVQIGAYIRDVCQNQKMQIVYISSKTFYAMELFRMRPMDFLVKPVDYGSVEHVMKVFTELLGAGQDVFQYQSGQNMYRLSYDEILYFMSEGRQIRIKTVKGESVPTFYGKLAQVEKQLNAEFMMIHKSYIVNHRYVRQYNYESVVMINGDELSISRPHRKEVRNQVMKLWRKQGGHE